MATLGNTFSDNRPAPSRFDFNGSVFEIGRCPDGFFYVDNIVFVHTSTHFVGVSFRTLGICRRSGPPFQIYLVSLPHGVIALNRKKLLSSFALAFLLLAGSACNDDSETETSSPTPSSNHPPRFPTPSPQPFKVRDPSHVASSH